jgi:hypothetical protein
VETVGADRVLWASDWPHQDGAWPDPIELLRDRPDLSEEDKRAIFVDGSARFYGIDLGALMAHLGPGWDGATPVSAITGMLSATTNAVAV